MSRVLLFKKSQFAITATTASIVVGASSPSFFLLYFSEQPFSGGSVLKGKEWSIFNRKKTNSQKRPIVRSCSVHIVTIVTPRSSYIKNVKLVITSREVGGGLLVRIFTGLIFCKRLQSSTPLRCEDLRKLSKKDRPKFFCASSLHLVLLLIRGKKNEERPEGPNDVPKHFRQCSGQILCECEP